MKWFKHEVDAHEGKILAHLYRKYGMSGEGRYWRLIGLLAKNFPPDKKGFFTLDIGVIQKRLNQKTTADCLALMEHMSAYKPTLDRLKEQDYPFIFEHSGNLCRIKYDKIAKIKDNHTRNLQAADKRLTSNLALDKKKNKNRRREEAGDASSLSPLKKSIPEVVAEITHLVRTFRPGSELKEHLKNASEEARKVFETNSMVAIGNSDSFELTGIVKNALRGVA